MPATLRLKISNLSRQVSTYDIVNEADEPVGLAQLRAIASMSSEMPEGFESHIYYEIKPDYRGKGYATDALSQLILEAGKNEIKPLIATVSASNSASIKVIEKNGGRLLQKGTTTNGKEVLKYSI